MRKLNFALAFFLSIALAPGASLIPTKEGTTWRYEMTDEGGSSSAPKHSQIRHRIAGIQEFEGKELLKLETFSGDVLTKTELVAVDENGILCFARSDKNGKITGFAAPQVIVPADLTKGGSWDCDDEIAGVRVQQHFVVADTENISVPAGYFQAVRLHCEESMPMSIVIDRWFVTGTGLVKEVVTLRSPSGELLQRRILELAKRPGVDGSEKDSPKKLTVGVSSQPVGRFEKEFPNTAQHLYARWQGNELRENSKVRAVWIAEDVGDIAPPNYKIDDAVATAGAPDAHGMFTLSRPDDGWAAGNYRVEFYLDETLVEIVKLKIK